MHSSVSYTRFLRLFCPTLQMRKTKKNCSVSTVHQNFPVSGRPTTQFLVLFIPSLVRVRRPCRGLEKFFPPVLQRCYVCSFHAQDIVHTGHGMLGYNCFFSFFLLERKVPAQSKLIE